MHFCAVHIPQWPQALSKFTTSPVYTEKVHLKNIERSYMNVKKHIKPPREDPVTCTCQALKTKCYVFTKMWTMATQIGALCCPSLPGALCNVHVVYIWRLCKFDLCAMLMHAIKHTVCPVLCVNYVCVDLHVQDSFPTEVDCGTNLCSV